MPMHCGNTLGCAAGMNTTISRQPVRSRSCCARRHGQGLDCADVLIERRGPHCARSSGRGAIIERGIRLVIPNVQVDMSAMPRQRMLAFLDTLGEFHHATAVENIHEGLERARKAGVKLGRPHSVNPHHDDVVRLRGQGFSGYKTRKRWVFRVPPFTKSSEHCSLINGI